MKLRVILLMLFVSLYSYGQKNERHVFDDVTFEVELTTINSIASDFGPAIVEGELIFTSFPTEIQKKSLRRDHNKVFYDLYKVGLDKEGSLDESRLNFDNVNREYHEGPVSYCEKTGELFMTRSNYEDPNVEKGFLKHRSNYHLEIVVAKKVEGEWKIIEEFPFNDPTFSTGHPAVNKAGDVIYFASDRPGGQGGTDLYKSERKNGEWTEPVNLGSTINTSGQEMFPFLNDDGVLIFASDGHAGVGALDICYAAPFNGDYKVENLGESVNSPSDDFGLVIYPNHKVGYFASNRSGGEGDDDIYKLNILSSLFKGKTIDHNGDILAETNVELYDSSGEVIQKTVSDENGHFSFKVASDKEYTLLGSKEFYKDANKKILNDSYAELQLIGIYKLELAVLNKEDYMPMADIPVLINGLDILSPANGLIKKDLAVNTDYHIALNKKGYLKQTIDITTKNLAPGIIRDTLFLFKAEVDKVFVLKNIFYDFDKWDILPESEVELNKLINIMNENPGLAVELGSHTDARGSDAYNMVLSEKRSKSAVGYLIKHGIDANRIKAKGYGESQLVNHCENDVKCPDWLHRQNRRTEMKIISFDEK
ncbi:hypothetical protein EYV94_05350 [Puteibacter caeruleilacunae]|nr:hypothetical protein EYV94_05350 [Puteibacter caeruleilacunae]